MKKIFAKSLFYLSLVMFASCDFETLFEPEFNEPVKEFFDTYTNTAAIEEHKLSVESYNDVSARMCINSDEECTVQFYMRNPQQYDLQTSVNFKSLEGIDTSLVKISQSDKNTIILTLPQSFLADSDEGHDISPTISMLEPLSGRSFADYSFSLFSNSMPPQLNNPTVMNDNNTTFIIAFDMPSQAELALRHKDLTTITINGKNYPVSISSDGNFKFSDSAFSTEEKTFNTISSKTFTFTDRSVYYYTGDPFANGDKEYTIILSDAAGLTTETLASTKITKLNTPNVLNAAGKAVESTYNSETKEYTPKSLPLLSGKEYSIVKITAPSQDNLGNEVDSAGLTVHYTLYNGTPRAAKLSKSGTFSGSIELNLAVGSWYLETYATKTNYEKSSVTKSYIRVVDSCIYVGQNGSDDDELADGTDGLPYASLAKAIADINKRNDSSVEYTLMIDGNIPGEANTDTILASGLLIEGAGSASTDKIGTFALTSSIPVTFKTVTVADLTAVSGNSITVSDDAAVTKATVKDGATLNIESNAVITEAVLEGSGTLTITGNLTQETAVTITNDSTPLTYVIGTKVITDNAYLATNYSRIKVKQNNDDTVWTVTSEGKLTETAARKITVSIPDIQEEEDINVTRSQSGNNVIFTITTTGLSNYVSTVDGTPQDGEARADGTYVLTLDTSSWVKGTYDVYLEAAKNSGTPSEIKYSYHAQIKIE